MKQFSIVFFILFLAACREPVVPPVDVDKIEVQIEVERLDQAIFSAASKNEVLAGIPSWRKKYGRFFDLYCGRILRLRGNTDSLLAEDLYNFKTNSDIQTIYQDYIKLFPFDRKPDFEPSLREAWKHYSYYFPEKLVPTHVAIHTGLNYSMVCADSVIGIGLDMYQGSAYKYYKEIGLPVYKCKLMRPEYLPIDLMKAWCETEFDTGKDPANMLEVMIRKGKIFYLLDAFFPEAHDSLKIGYTAEQFDFCKKNESMIWSVFIGKKLLFSSNPHDYQKFISEGPTTGGFPRESPGMIACWTGWQIIRKYMKENPGTSIKMLMEENDCQKILSKSKYKPEK